MLSAREVIDDIRRTEFGLGEPDSIRAIRNLRAKLHRALQQLAEEIYADGIHFILELVQNAEDNEYGEAAPELRFVLSRTHLHVLNNESGFGEPSVRAICDVSCSTKTKAKGHIGEKGIGFKSVFRVTDEPQIFSNGYQFRLPKHDPDTRLGYVVPFWVDNVPSQVVPGVTNILLPLNADASDELAKVADIRPAMLLFLKQLCSVTVEDQVRGRQTQISRSGDDHRVELWSGSGVEHWTLIRRTVPVRADIREEKRKDITHTELAIALPLTADGDADGGHFHQVHAYLPIDDYGLRFAFHADFVLAAGREGILTDRPWNVWLRDSLPDLFLAAVEACKTDERLWASFLAYVPRREDDIDAFFIPAAKAIRQGLREAPCVLSASSRWVTPSRSLIVDSDLREILSTADVSRQLGREFVACVFRADAALLRCLGARDYTLDDLVECLQDEDWVAQRPDEWFSTLFAYLSTQDLDACLEELQELRIVPLEGGGLTSVMGAVGGVFFPPSRERKYGFESGLQVVRRSVLSPAEKGQAAPVSRFLRHLGVKKASPVDLIKDHMLPLFAGDVWRTTKDDDFRLGCVEYVKDHWDECRKAPGLVGKLRAGLWIRIEDSNRYNRACWMYLSKAYGNTTPLKTLFRDIDDIWFVDSAYLDRAVQRLKAQKARAKHGKVTRADRKRLREAWREFFVDLGAEIGIRVVPEPNNEKSNEAQSPDLAKVIKTGEVDRITLALSLLDAEWNRYAQWMTTRLVPQPRGRTPDVGPARTAFGSLLTDSAWIPVVGGGLAKPGAVFCDTPATRALLGDRVAYLAVPLASAGFIDALGIHREPTVDAVIGRLRHLTRSGVRERASFEPLYTFLQDHHHKASGTIDTAFWQEPLILIPGETPRVVRAVYAFWKDASALFGDSRGYLEPIYPQHKKFFRTQLEVREAPMLEDYGDRLVELAEGGVADAASEKVVWEIYKEFNRQMRERRQHDEIMAAEWWAEFIDQAVFLSEDGTFVEREVVVANDSDYFAASFRGRSGVTFFKSPAYRLPEVRHFLRGADVRFLSQVVKQEAVVPPTSEPNDPLTDQLRLITPFLLRYLHHCESDLYDRLKAMGKLGRLESMRARTCERTRARLLLGTVTVEVDRAAVVAEDTLFVRIDALDDTDSVAIALALWLGNPKGLEDFLVSLLEKQEAKKINRFLTRKGIPDLPGDETETIGEAVRSAEFGASGTPRPAQPPVEEPAAVSLGVSNGRDTAAGPGVPVPAPSSAAPIGGCCPGSDLPVDRGGPPSQPESRDGTRERQRAASPAPPRPQAAASDAQRPPSPATEGTLAPDWRECEPGEARVSWNVYEPLQPRDPRPVPSPGSATSPEHQQWAERSIYGATGSSSDVEPDDPPDVRCDVGRWGEEYALGCLREELLAKYPGAVSEETARGFRLRRVGGIVTELIWLNRNGEQGVGHDIEVIEEASRLFVEVKSTRDDARAVFDLSDAQWELAKAQGPSYRITRVYNAGRREARAVHVADPYRAWQTGELTIRSLRIVL
jgi:hypothetical protein